MTKNFLIILMGLITFLSSGATENISGVWKGLLKLTPQNELNLVFHFSKDDAEKDIFYLDSPDQGAFGIPGEVNIISSDSVSVTIQRIGASFQGGLKENKINGVFRQGFATFPLELSLGDAVLKRPQTPEPPFDYTIKEVTFSNPAASAVLAGTLTLPKNKKEDTPIVVMISGSGLQNRDEEIFGHHPFAVIADFLVSNGIASLRYDDRGYEASTGDPSNATTLDFAQDAKCAVEYLRTKENFNNIGILGHSEGATIAFILADTKEKVLFANPSFIIGLGTPAVRGDSILADQSATTLLMSGIAEKPVKDFSEALLQIYKLKGEGKTVNERDIETLCSAWPSDMIYAALKQGLKENAGNNNPWINFFVSYSPSENIPGVKCPALAIYGEKDIQVSSKLNIPAMIKLSPKTEIKEYPFLNHLFQHAETGSVAEYSKIEETIAPEVLSDIVNFITSLREQ